MELLSILASWHPVMEMSLFSTFQRYTFVNILNISSETTYLDSPWLCKPLDDGGGQEREGGERQGLVGLCVEDLGQGVGGAAWRWSHPRLHQFASPLLVIWRKKKSLQ